MCAPLWVPVQRIDWDDEMLLYADAEPWIRGCVGLGIVARKWHSTLTGDVVLELLNDEFLLGDYVFDQVADGN